MASHFGWLYSVHLFGNTDLFVQHIFIHPDGTWSTSSQTLTHIRTPMYVFKAHGVVKEVPRTQWQDWRMRWGQLCEGRNDRLYWLGSSAQTGHPSCPSSIISLQQVFNCTALSFTLTHYIWSGCTGCINCPVATAQRCRNALLHSPPGQWLKGLWVPSTSGGFKTLLGYLHWFLFSGVSARAFLVVKYFWNDPCS